MSDDKKELEEFGLVEQRQIQRYEVLKDLVDVRVRDAVMDLHLLQQTRNSAASTRRYVAHHITENGRIAKSLRRISSTQQLIEISTVELRPQGSYGYANNYETMIFGGRDDGYCVSYETKELAIEGHGHVLTRVDKYCESP